MSKKRTYRSVDVQKVEVSSFIALLVAACSVIGVDPLRCIVAIDVAKTKFFAGFATAKGELVRIVRFEHPRQTAEFLRLLHEARTAGLGVEVAMEPTGTYGDAIRERCEAGGLPVFMVSPKRAHDMAEVLDGVPSLHDAKATAIIAQLHALGKSRRYQPASEARRTARALLDRRAIYQEPLESNFGKLEALMARHWPELEQWVDFRSQRSWMPVLIQFPGPESVAASPVQVAELLRKASRGRCKPETIEGILACARSTFGVAMNDTERALLSSLVTEIERLTKSVAAVDKQITQVVRNDEVIQAIAATVGVVTATVLVCFVGDPRDFHCASAYEKAFGLNLKVRSSGKHVGELKLTKRGPSVARKYLFLAALRLIASDPITAAWYKKRKSYNANLKKKAVVAVMRKLVRALFHVARGNRFDSSKLFDTRRLSLEPDADASAKRRRNSKTQTATTSRRTTRGAQEVSVG